MDLKKYLKSTIPEFQQGHPQLDSYLDSAGEFLNDISEAIEHFDFSHDYEKGEVFNIQNALSGKGVTPPKALKEETKRRILRDIHEFFLKNGTEDALRHSLRLIGVNAEIKRGWLPSATSLRTGSITSPFTGGSDRYDLDKYVYTELLYGDEKVTPDGVFFNGVRYSDILNEDISQDLPILGERYKTPVDPTLAVSKTPYILVRFSESDFNISVEDYVSPDGEVYSYSVGEGFELANEVIDYFIKSDEIRPTTIRVIIAIALSPFFDTIGSFVDSDYSEVHTRTGDDLYDDIGDLEDYPEIVGEVSVDSSIGRAMNIGAIETPHVSQYSMVSSPAIGDVSAIEQERYDWSYMSFNYNMYFDREYPHIPIRPYVDISLISPSDAPIYVYGGSYDVSGNISETLIDTIAEDTFYEYTSGTNYHFIRFDSLTTQPVPLSIVYNTN